MTRANVRGGQKGETCMGDFLKEYLPKIAPYRGRVFGSLIGLCCGILWVFMGFWKALAFMICLLLGYFLGKRIDERGSLREIINRIFPPND